MVHIEINFTLPEGAFAVKDCAEKFYVSDINGENFNHGKWSKFTASMPKHMIGEVLSYHPSNLFDTRGEALVQAQIARINYAECKIAAMRQKGLITRDQYLNARNRLSADREMYEVQSFDTEVSPAI